MGLREAPLAANFLRLVDILKFTFAILAISFIVKPRNRNFETSTKRKVLSSSSEKNFFEA